MWVSKEAPQRLVIREEEAPQALPPVSHFNPSSTVCIGTSGDWCGLMKRRFEWMALCTAEREREGWGGAGWGAGTERLLMESRYCEVLEHSVKYSWIGPEYLYMFQDFTRKRPVSPVPLVVLGALGRQNIVLFFSPIPVRLLCLWCNNKAQTHNLINSRAEKLCLKQYVFLAVSSFSTLQMPKPPLPTPPPHPNPPAVHHLSYFHSFSETCSNPWGDSWTCRFS